MQPPSTSFLCATRHRFMQHKIGVKYKNKLFYIDGEIFRYKYGTCGACPCGSRELDNVDPHVREDKSIPTRPMFLGTLCACPFPF
jgi:hypothetical protein